MRFEELYRDDRTEAQVRDALVALSRVRPGHLDQWVRESIRHNLKVLAEKMTMISFTVPGPPVGYTRTTQRQQWVDERWKRYREFKKKVWRIARSADRRKQLAALDACEHKWFLEIEIWYRSDARGGRYKRPDPTNVLNGVIDAIFSEDRNVIGSVRDFHIDPENPRIEVWIWEEPDNA
jgi:hypothetical protein